MKKITCKLMAVVILAGMSFGCWGGEGEKNANSGKDKPVPAEKAGEEK